MAHRSRLCLVLAAAAALCACSDDAAAPDAVAAVDAFEHRSGPLVESDSTGTTKTEVPYVPDVRSGRGAGDGPIDDPFGGNGEETRLTRAILTLDVDDEGAINRTLLQFGAGVSVREDERARRVAQTLTRLAKNERAVVRRGALALLGRMPLGRLLGDPFVPAMFDPDAGVRRQAVIGRTRQGLATAWRNLTPLAGDPDPSVRATVARSLALVEQPEARAALARLINDADDGVVEAAAVALTTVDGFEAPASVFDAAGSARPIVRHAAAIVLGHSRGDAALKKLASLSRDESPAVRKEAVWGMAAFGGNTADDARAYLELIAYDPVRRGRNDRFEALQGLARTEHGPDLDKMLAVAVSDKDEVLRLVAARTSILRGDARALPALVSLLDTTDLEGVDGDEEAEFVRRTAEVLLCDAAGVAQGLRTTSEWRVAIPEVAARLSKGRDRDTHPPRLAQRW